MTDLEKYRNRIYCNRWRLKRLNNGWQASTFVLPGDVMRSVKQVRDILMKNREKGK